MSEIFNDKKLSRRVVAVLGKDPNDDVGYTDQDIQRLDAAKVFQPGAPGPWTPKPQDPAFRDVLVKMESIQKDLESVREEMKKLPIPRNWAGAVTKVMQDYERIPQEWRKKFL